MINVYNYDEIMKVTVHSLFSVSRLATTEPADPAPTIIKSYSSGSLFIC